jgi:hypothetical protein
VLNCFEILLRMFGWFSISYYARSAVVKLDLLSGVWDRRARDLGYKCCTYHAVKVVIRVDEINAL